MAENFVKYLHLLSLLIFCFLTTFLMSKGTFCSSNNENWKTFLISQFESAGESIDVAIYSFADKGFADCLIQAHRQGVRVRVYLDKTEMTKRVRARRCLGENGIDIRFSAKPHAIKENFCIIDGKKLVRDFPHWTGVLSYANEEKLLISKDWGIVSTYSSKFEGLWNLHFSVIYPYRY